MASFMRNGVEVQVLGQITFDEKDGYTCTVRARGPVGGWEKATATGDSLAQAREAAYDKATAKVRSKGNA